MRPPKQREPGDPRYDEDLKRLLDAGLDDDAAAKVAAHPMGGPVVLAPGVIISLFPVRARRG